MPRSTHSVAPMAKERNICTAQPEKEMVFLGVRKPSRTKGTVLLREVMVNRTLMVIQTVMIFPINILRILRKWKLRLKVEGYAPYYTSEMKLKK